MRLKTRIGAAACALALFAAPAAQAAWGGVDHLTAAVGATLKFALQKNGVDPATGEGAETLSAVSNALERLSKAQQGTGSTHRSWTNFLKWLFKDDQGHSFGGGGASGTWDDYCDFPVRLDLNGNLVIPASPLAPPKGVNIPITSQDWYGRHVVYMPNNNPENWVNIWGETYSDAFNWYLHKRNSAMGAEQATWMGLYRLNGDQMIYNRPAVQLVSGAVISAIMEQVTGGSARFSSNCYGNHPECLSNKPCPAAGVSGGANVHFWATTNGSFPSGFGTCTAYALNYNLSPSGYAHGRYVYIPATDLPTWPAMAPDHLKKCKISAQMIASIVNKLWQDAAAQSGYAGVAPTEVTAEDVRTDGTMPTIDDLNDDPRDGLPDEIGEPLPVPQDPPSSNNGKPIDVNWGPAGPAPTPDSDLSPPDFGWWPEMPEIEILTSSTCPTWTFEALEQEFTIDAHCPLAEDNRAIISALMLIVFAISSARIVMEA